MGFNVTAISPTSGPAAGGTPVTITGAGFATAILEGVRFGAAQATSFVVVGDTKITCVTPAGILGTVTVTVFDDVGDSASLANAFTYTIAPPVFTAYGNQLAKLLPPGKLHLEEGSELQRTLVAMGDEFARVEVRGATMVEESDPRTATETIADWERVLSLPDARVPVISAVLAERRVAVVQKWIARGGQDVAFFKALVAACGWVLDSLETYAGGVSDVFTIRLPMLRVGFRVQALTPTDASRVFGDVYAYAIKLKLSSDPGPKLTEAQLEAVIRHATHAHIQVVFMYV